MSERPTLPPGQLPDIHDTDPPELHPATVVGDGVVYVDETKLHHTTRHPQQEREHVARALAERAQEALQQHK